jgi:hypothetical protein
MNISGGRKSGMRFGTESAGGIRARAPGGSSCMDIKSIWAVSVVTDARQSMDNIYFIFSGNGKDYALKALSLRPLKRKK